MSKSIRDFARQVYVDAKDSLKQLKDQRDAASSFDQDASVLGLSAISNMNPYDEFGDLSEYSGSKSVIFAGKLETIDENPTSRRIRNQDRGAMKEGIRPPSTITETPKMSPDKNVKGSIASVKKQ